MTEDYIQSELLRLFEEEQIPYNQEGRARIESFLLDLMLVPEIDYTMSLKEDGTLNIYFFTTKFDKKPGI